jgi:hypothetical protein
MAFQFTPGAFLSRVLSESFGLTDAQTKAIQTAKSESFSLSDSKLFDLARTINEEFNFNEELTKSILKEFIETANLFTNLPKPIAHWKLNEISGAYDSIGTNDGTLQNGAVPGVDGKIGKAVQFDGSNDYINIPNSAGDLNFNKEGIYTFAFWSKASDTGPNGIFKMQKVGMLVEYGSTFDFIDTVTPGWTRWKFANTGYVNNWKHYALVYNGQTQTIKLYIDGIEANTNQNNYNWDSNTNSTGSVTIGQWYNYNGTIDDARIYNQELTQSQINKIYNSGRGTENDYQPQINFSTIKSISENLSISTTDSINKDISRGLNETYSLTDTILKTIEREFAEELSLADDLEAVKIVIKNLLESLSLSDSKSFQITKQVTEIMDLSDGDVKLIQRIFEELFGVSATITKQMQRLFTEEVTLNEQRLMGFSREFAESITLSENFIKQTEREFTESITMSENRSVSLIKVLSENLLFNDQILRDIQRTIIEQYSFLDYLDPKKITVKNLSEILSLTDSKSFDISKVISEIMTLSDGDAKLIQRLFSESFGFSESVEKQIEKMFLESMSLTDEKTLSIAKQLTEGMSLTGTISKSITRELLDSIGLSDGDSPITINKILSESFSLEDNFIKFLTSWINTNSIRSDLQAIIQDEGVEATLIRQTTTTDNQGGVTAVSEEEYEIYMVSQGILRSDRQIHNMGLALPGTERVFLFHSYPNSITGNGTLIPRVGDLIKDDEEIYWRIEEITAEHEMNGSEIFKSVLIKKVDLTQ